MQRQCQITKALMQNCILIKAHGDANSRRGQTNKSTLKCKSPHKQISTHPDILVCVFRKQMHTYPERHTYMYILSPDITVGLQYVVPVCGLVLLTTLQCKYTEE